MVYKLKSSGSVTNLREGPSTLAEKVGQLGQSFTMVAAIERRVTFSDGYWWSKLTLCNGEEVYAASEYMEVYYDVWDYVIGDPAIQYGLQYQWDGGGEEVVYNEVDLNVAYVVKGQNSEALWADDNFVYRGLDTSPSHDTFYIPMTQVGNTLEYGIKWTPRFMKAGQSLSTYQIIEFYKKDDPEELVSRHGWTINVRLVGVYKNLSLPTGHVLDEVLVLRSTIDTGTELIPFETMFYGKDIGLVGFRRDDRNGITSEWIQENPTLINGPTGSDFQWFSAYNGIKGAGERLPRLIIQGVDDAPDGVIPTYEDCGDVPLIPELPSDVCADNGLAYIENWNFYGEVDDERYGEGNDGIISEPFGWNVGVQPNDAKIWVFDNTLNGGWKIEVGQVKAYSYITQEKGLCLKAGRYIIPYDMAIVKSAGDDKHITFGPHFKLGDKQYQHNVYAENPIEWALNSAPVNGFEVGGLPFRYNYKDHKHMVQGPVSLQLEVLSDTYFAEFGMGVSVEQADVVAQFLFFKFAVDPAPNWDDKAWRLVCDGEAIHAYNPVQSEPEQPPTDGNAYSQMVITLPVPYEKLIEMFNNANVRLLSGDDNVITPDAIVGE